MASDKENFIVLDGKAKTFNIAARRLGSEDRYAVVATATSEVLATRIVKALAHLQGDEVKLDHPNERLVQGTRALLDEARQATKDAEHNFRNSEQKLREVSRELANVQSERNKLQVELRAAQTANKEKA